MKIFGKIILIVLIVLGGLSYFGMKQMAENEDFRKAQGVSWEQLELFGFERPKNKDRQNLNIANPMPLTTNNIDEYLHRTIKASKNIPLGTNSVDAAIYIFKMPIIDMGYNFDDTLLNSIKTLRNIDQPSIASQKVSAFLIPILMVIHENRESVIQKKFISKNTLDEIEQETTGRHNEPIKKRELLSQ